MKRIVWLVLLAMFAIPVAALAQADFSQTLELTPTKYGETLGAAGKVSLEITAKGIEIFTVSAMAKVPSRTMLTVQVSNQADSFEIGAVRMLLGLGAFEQWSTLDASPVFPVAALERITVYRGKEAILEGTFDDRIVTLGDR